MCLWVGVCVRARVCACVVERARVCVHVFGVWMSRG